MGGFQTKCDCLAALTLPTHTAADGIVKTENTRKAVLVGLHPPFRRARPLKWRTGSAILQSLSVSIVLTQPSCRLVIQPCMKSSSPGLALRSLRALEVIGSDSDLVAQAT